MSESEDRYINSVEFDPLQRKDFCRLLLTLIQNVDMSLAQLSTKILANQDGFEIHQGKYYCFNKVSMSMGFVFGIWNYECQLKSGFCKKSRSSYEVYTLALRT